MDKLNWSKARGSTGRRGGILGALPGCGSCLSDWMTCLCVRGGAVCEDVQLLSWAEHRAFVMERNQSEEGLIADSFLRAGSLYVLSIYLFFFSILFSGVNFCLLFFISSFCAVYKTRKD